MHLELINALVVGLGKGNRKTNGTKISLACDRLE